MEWLFSMNDTHFIKLSFENCYTTLRLNILVCHSRNLVFITSTMLFLIPLRILRVNNKIEANLILMPFPLQKHNCSGTALLKLSF